MVHESQRPCATTCASGEDGAPAPRSREFLWDRNSTRHLAFLGASAATGPLAPITYPLLHLLTDVLYYKFERPFFDPEVTIERGYHLSAQFNDTLHSQGLDYGFNFYDGDYDKSRAQAQIDKFDYAIEQLGLEPGMRVCDIGCGCGDWLAYLRDKGMEVAGVNITQRQVDECRSRGLEVYCSNWKDVDGDAELREKLYGRFDAVTFWDTVEHYVPMRYVVNRDKTDAIYRDMYRLAHDLIREDSPCGRVFISCLHMRKTLRGYAPSLETLRSLVYCYLLDKFHSGCYPSGARDELVLNAKPRFDLIHRRDTTMDYYMTSVLEPTHFGRHKFKWNGKRLRLALWTVLADPFWFHRLLWFTLENWMFQFDPDDIDNSDVVHWWLCFQSNGPQPAR